MVDSVVVNTVIYVIGCTHWKDKFWGFGMLDL